MAHSHICQASIGQLASTTGVYRVTHLSSRSRARAGASYERMEVDSATWASWRRRKTPAPPRNPNIQQSHEYRGVREPVAPSVSLQSPIRRRRGGVYIRSPEFPPARVRIPGTIARQKRDTARPESGLWLGAHVPRRNHPGMDVDCKSQFVMYGQGQGGQPTTRAARAQDSLRRVALAELDLKLLNA